jgi:hypothetical protein
MTLQNYNIIHLLYFISPCSCPEEEVAVETRGKSLSQLVEVIVYQICVDHHEIVPGSCDADSCIVAQTAAGIVVCGCRHWVRKIFEVLPL